MKRVALGSAFLIAVALPLVHCSSKSSGNPGNQPDSGTSAVVDSGSSTVTDSGTSVTGDTGTVVASEGGCQIPPGGKACDPGNVQCNSAPCAVPANICCGNVNDAGMTSESCEAKSAACGGVSEACDETSDCTGGNLCCLTAAMATGGGGTDGYQISVGCAAACNGGIISVQVCKSNSECPGGTCIPQYCSVASLTIEACSVLPTCVALDAGM